MPFLHKSGELTKFYPEDLIENDSALSVKVKYEVHLLNSDNEVVVIEKFDSYPNLDSIRWCLLRHKDKGARKANVKKIYVSVWDY